MITLMDKNFMALILFPCLLIAGSCSEKEKTTETEYSFILSKQSISLKKGESVSIGVKGVVNHATTGDYDFSKDILSLHFESSDTDIATVDGTGLVTALASGKCEIKVTSYSTWEMQDVQVRVGVNPDISSGAIVTDLHTFTQDIGQSLTGDMVFLPTGIVPTSQGLDVDKDGNRFVSWETDGSVSIARIPAGKSVADPTMYCRYGGHGDGFCVENTEDGVYVWTVGSLGENAGYYGGKAATSETRLICRYKYEAGKTVYPEEAADLFYINVNGARMMSVDLEHNQFGIWTYSTTDVLKFFNYEEVLGAPYKSLSVTREDRRAASVKAHDLSRLTPLGDFTWDRKIYCGTDNGSVNAVQGYCIYDSRAYILAGYKNDDASTISIADIDGNWTTTRQAVGVSANKQTLVNLNLSKDGTLEPEGVQIHFGKMYLVFMSDMATAAKKGTSIICLK